MFDSVFSAVIVANLLTACAIYGMWRITKNEWDFKGMLWIIIPGLLIAFLAY
jgi:hypothetical protein